MRHIINIDDDPVNNFLCEYMIGSSYPGTIINSFTNPVKALSWFSVNPVDPETIILLDLNMPEMNGWEFLEEFEKMNINCLGFIISSSVNPADAMESGKHPIIKGFYSKPISLKDVDFILNFNE